MLNSTLSDRGSFMKTLCNRLWQQFEKFVKTTCSIWKIFEWILVVNNGICGKCQSADRDWAEWVSTKQGYLGPAGTQGTLWTNGALFVINEIMKIKKNWYFKSKRVPIKYDFESIISSKKQNMQEDGNAVLAYCGHAAVDARRIAVRFLNMR